MKKVFTAILALVLVFSFGKANACTNFLITKGASTDGSCMAMLPTAMCCMASFTIIPPPTGRQAPCATCTTGTAACIAAKSPKWHIPTTWSAT